MKIGLFTVLFNDKPLEEVADYAAGLGYEMVELAAWRGSNHFDTDRAAEDIDYAKGIKKMLADKGLEISALSNHLFSQMVLPFNDASLDEWAGTSDKEEMVKLGTEHILKTARVASELEIETVVGFFGSTVWESWYIWPPQRLKIYEEGWDLFVERWNPILDEFAKLGVRFAHEVHPTEIAYNVYTAEEAIKRLGRDDWGFNFDPSHLIWQMIDPVVFIKKFGIADLPRPREGLGAPEGHPPHRRRHRDRLVAARRPRRPLSRPRLGRRGVAAGDDGAARGRLRLRALVRARGPGHVGGGRLRAVHPVPQAADHQEAAGPGSGLVAGVSTRRGLDELASERMPCPAWPANRSGKSRDVGFVTMGQAEAAEEIPTIGIGMLGYAFMGKAHSNALKKIAYMTWPPPYIPRLVAISGRTEDAVTRGGATIRLREVVDELAGRRRRPGGADLRQRRAERHACGAVDRGRKGRQARDLREAARPDGRARATRSGRRSRRRA